MKAVSVIFLIFLCQNAKAEGYYDFIIVGGGTAGLAIARRLTESKVHSVLVIESGGLPKPGMDVPALASNFVNDSEVLFQYQSEPQSRSGQRYDNGRMPIIAGRVLGGSSNLNFMYFNRGNPYDYDNWARLANDSSWNYSNMLEHFKNVETYKGEYPSNQHGYEGPITVSRPSYSPGLASFLAAGQELGYPVADPNGPQQRSFTKIEFSKRFGRRQSSLRGYIEPIIHTAQNLKILLNANVTKLVFRGSRVIGVELSSESANLLSIHDNILYANKEVVITAGTYGSPQILQRSGIGPINILNAAGIRVIKDLPVGENFHDHLALSIPVIVNTTSVVMDNARDLTQENWKYYLETGDGPYSTLLGMSGQGFAVSSVAKKSQQELWPDIHLAPLNSVDWFRSIPYANITENSIKPWEGPMAIGVFVARPYSRGTVHLSPQDSNGPPVINGGYLKDERDVQILLDGIREALRIYEETLTFKKMGAKIVPIPVCTKFPYRSEEYWRCYLRYMTTTAHHPVGTCKMGSGKHDPTAVVDSKLRVIGIQGLRVADASIMPVITNANIQAVVYAIAEKASETILKDWGK